MDNEPGYIFASLLVTLGIMVLLYGCGLQNIVYCIIGFAIILISAWINQMTLKWSRS